MDRPLVFCHIGCYDSRGRVVRLCGTSPPEVTVRIGKKIGRYAQSHISESLKTLNYCLRFVFTDTQNKKKLNVVLDEWEHRSDRGRFSVHPNTRSRAVTDAVLSRRSVVLKFFFLGSPPGFSLEGLSRPHVVLKTSRDPTENRLARLRTAVIDCRRRVARVYVVRNVKRTLLDGRLRQPYGKKTVSVPTRVRRITRYACVHGRRWPRGDAYYLSPHNVRNGSRT